MDLSNADKIPLLEARNRELEAELAECKNSEGHIIDTGIIHEFMETEARAEKAEARVAELENMPCPECGGRNWYPSEKEED